MVTYTFTNGTVADADEVNQNFTDVTTKYYFNNSSASTNSTTGESDLLSLTIPQNDLGNSGWIKIDAPIHVSNSISGGAGGVFRLYVNGSVVKSVSIFTREYTQSGTCISHIVENINTISGDVEVKVTGDSSKNATKQCFGLTAIGGRM